MKKAFCFFCIFSVCCAKYYAQDYVVNKPTKPHRKPILFSQIANPDYTNYFLTPTAFALPKRDIRLSDTDVLFAKGSYGLTNKTLVSANISMFGMVTAAIKSQLEINEDISIAATASIGELTAISPDSVVLFAGGAVLGTYGNHQNNLTVGVGYYYVKSTFDLINEIRNIPLYHVFFGLQKQITRRVYMVVEGMYFPDYKVYSGAAGIKIIIQESMSLNFGVTPIAWNDVRRNKTVLDGNIIPMVSFRMLLDRH